LEPDFWALLASFVVVSSANQPHQQPCLLARGDRHPDLDFTIHSFIATALRLLRERAAVYFGASDPSAERRTQL
jgi:hypothetical protein